MPEEDIAVPGVGRRLLIFIVTLFMGTWPTACQLQNNQNPPADGLPPPKQLKILQRTVCRLQSDQKSTGEPSADSKTAKILRQTVCRLQNDPKSPADRLPAHHAIDPIGHAVIERIGKYAFGFVAINLRKMCSFLKRSVYL